MEKNNMLVSLLLLVLLFSGYCSKKADSPVLKGPYLAQKPPGMTPEIFAPGYINGKT
jgi:hypothetical protein